MMDAGMVKMPKPRGVLLKFLEDPQLASKTFPQHYFQSCLREALEGLHALEYGEAQPIFTPRETKSKGATPYSAMKSRMIALGLVDLLRTKGYKAGKARAKVAIAYGVGRATIKGWRKGLDKSGDPWMQNFRKAIAGSTDWDDQRVTEELLEAAKNYVIANKKKKQEKKQKKTQGDDSPPRG
jgi:hypothetical protein